MIKLFSGSTNYKLSQEVADRLKIHLAKAEIARFSNSEIRVTIFEEVKDQNCVIIQPTANPTNNSLMEFFLFADALKRCQAKKIIGVVPYFGYARQNKEHRSGESVSVNVVIRFMETVGYDKIYTFDIHDEGTEGIFTIPFKNLSVLPMLAKHIKKKMTENEVKQTIVVSPDQGGVERARIFANSFHDKKVNVAVIEKKRDLDKIHNSEALELFGNVNGKNVILVDDIITSGGTLINAAKLCFASGAKKIYAVIVHHDFSPEAPRKLQKSIIEKIYTTNTIELKFAQNFPKLEEVTIAPLIVQEIKNI